MVSRGNKRTEREKQKKGSRNDGKELTLSCSVPKMEAKKFAIVVCDVPDVVSSGKWNGKAGEFAFGGS
jgi:hypothetical protein